MQPNEPMSQFRSLLSWVQCNRPMPTQATVCHRCSYNALESLLWNLSQFPI